MSSLPDSDKLVEGVNTLQFKDMIWNEETIIGLYTPSLSRSTKGRVKDLVYWMDIDYEKVVVYKYKGSLTYGEKRNQVNQRDSVEDVRYKSWWRLSEMFDVDGES